MAFDLIQALEGALGYAFADKALLWRALTHASSLERERRESYERLEFLGDRVLGLAIANVLYHRYPDADEGALARRLNGLVRRETCADRAIFLGIDKALVLGTSETQAGGRAKPAILADACESVLGAIHLDGGFSAAEAVVLRVWAPLISNETRPALDPKTELQERVQRTGKAPPTYRVAGRRGPDHQPHFVIEALSEAGVLGVGEGGSKRAGEQAAARAALEAMGVDRRKDEA